MEISPNSRPQRYTTCAYINMIFVCKSHECIFYNNIKYTPIVFIIYYIVFHYTKKKTLRKSSIKNITRRCFAMEIIIIYSIENKSSVSFRSQKICSVMTTRCFIYDYYLYICVTIFRVETYFCCLFLSSNSVYYNNLSPRLTRQIIYYVIGI